MKPILFIISLLIVFSAFGRESLPGLGISGTVRYLNADSTPLRHAAVILSDSLGTALDTLYTDAGGNFSFSNLTAGTYHLKARPVHPAGGINAADALAALQHFTGAIILTGLKSEAADVNISGYVNASDAFLIQKRFVGMINTFPAGDWISENKTLALQSQDTYVSLHVICAGDVNASYIPDNTILLFCGDTLTDTRDGQKYPTVQIGNQCWMAKNLNVGSFSYIFSASNNGIIEKYGLNNDSTSCETWGGFYCWDEMMQYNTTPGAQGICPIGFHLPIIEEWEELIFFLGGSSIAGGKMKEIGYVHWFQPNTAATNSSGFSALGAGLCFGPLYTDAIFWSSTLSLTGAPYTVSLFHTSASTVIYNIFAYFYGLSVRCLKN